MEFEKELEEFRTFHKNYCFEYFDIIQKDDNLYCDGELLQVGDEKPLGESNRWINVGYNLKGDYSKVLSNLFPYDFEFRGKKLRSIESFFQGIKFKSVELQNLVFDYSGIESNVIKIASDYNWQEDGIVYFEGVPIKRDSEEYDRLIEELYISAIQNPLYRNILKKIDKPIIHSIGRECKEETVFTRFEFEEMLNCLVCFLRRK